MSAHFFTLIRNGDTQGVQRALTDDPALLSATDERGFPPLILSGYLGHLELTTFLLEQGADPNQRDSAGNTCLMGVCFKGSTDIANALIEKGAEVNVTNLRGGTALTYAATFGHARLVSLLLEKGANPSHKDDQGQTALSHARAKGHTEIAGILEAASL